MESTTSSDSAVRVYKVQSCLGRGAFGEVYRAEMVDGGITQIVAMKVLAPTIVDPNAQSAERLRDEAMFLGNLRHRALPKVHTITEVNGRTTLVMEYIEGEDGTKLIKAGVPVAAVSEIVAELAGALHAAHTAQIGEHTGIVHRDVKPGNFMLAKDGAVKLMDFGIASADAEVRTAKTQTDMMVGSIQYMSPERFSIAEAHPAWDVYAVGQIFYELLSGERLWKGMSQEMIFGHAFDPDRHAAHVAMCLTEPRIHRDVAELIRQCLSFEPEDRPSAHELEVRCRKLMRSLPGQSLWEWVHGHDWAPPDEEAGPLVGHVIQDGTLALANPSVETTPLIFSRPQRRSRLPVALAIGSLLAVGLVVVIGGAGALVASGALTGADPDASMQELAEADEAALLEVQADPMGEAVAEPVLEPEPVAEPDPEPKLVASGRRRVVEVAPTPPVVVRVPPPQPDPVVQVPEPTPPPVVAEVEPAPAPAPAVKPQPVGRVVIDGQGIDLRGEAGRFGTGEVPVGTYAIFAPFGGAPENAGSVVVTEGASVTITCSVLLEKCKAT